MKPADIAGPQQVRLFAGLSPQDLATTARRGVRRKMQRNTVFIEHRDASSTLFLMLSGRAKVYEQDAQARAQWLRTVGPGDHLGELAVVRDDAARPVIA